MSPAWRTRIVEVSLLLWVFLAPIRPAMACVLILPLVDLVLALICAVRAGRPLRSSGMKRTIGKIFLYEMATSLAYLTETFLTGPIVPLVRLITGLIGVTELKSCLEHLDELNGSPFFKTLLDKLTPPNEDK